MTESSTTVRLSKAAKEFNVGTATIVEFLSKKGHTIDPNPNTRLSPEAYELVRKEYSQEKKVKEVSKQIEMGGSNRKTITAELVSQPFEDEEDIDTSNLIRASRISPTPAKTQAAAPPAPEPPKVEPKPAVEAPPEPVTIQEEKHPEPPAAEFKKTDEPLEEIVHQAPAPATVEITVAPEQVESRAPEIIPTAEELPQAQKPDGELKILGKIDLDSLNQKTKPDKKTRNERIRESEKRKEEERTKREQEAAARKNAESDAAKAAQAAQPVAPEPIQNPELAAPAAEPGQPVRPDNFLATKVDKLSGPKVLGKIDISSFTNTPSKPKPVATSSDPKPGQDGKKKKRKRIKNKGAEQTPPPAQDRPAQPRDLHRKGKPAPKKEEKVEVSDEEIQRQIKETLARLTAPGKSKAAKHRRQKREAFSDKMAEEMARQEEEKSILKVTEFVTVNELATMML